MRALATGIPTMYETIMFSDHALEEGAEEGLSPDELRAMVRSGTVIEDTRNPGRPLPTRVVLASARGRTYHVVIGYDDARSFAVVVTVYEPDPARWSPDFRRRVPK
jgi:hypothetical protein